MASEECEESVVVATNNGGVVSGDFSLLENSTHFHFSLVIVWEKNHVNFGEPLFSSIWATHGFRKIISSRSPSYS